MLLSFSYRSYDYCHHTCQCDSNQCDSNELLEFYCRIVVIPSFINIYGIFCHVEAASTTQEQRVAVGCSNRTDPERVPHSLGRTTV